MMPSPHRISAPRALAVAAAAVALILSPGAAQAGDLFHDAILGLPIGDDARFFLNLTNQHFAAAPAAAVAVVRRCARPEDDFPVVMMLSAASGRQADAILSMHLRGLSWAEVLFRLEISPQILFAGMDRNPGPPYGHAWGYWKTHQAKPAKAPRARFEIADAQVVELARLQIASAFYRVSPYAVIGERQRGMTVERYAVIHGRPSGAVGVVKHGGARPVRAKTRGHGPEHAPKNR